MVSVPDEPPPNTHNVVHATTANVVQAGTAGDIHYHPPKPSPDIPRRWLVLGIIAALALAAIAVKHWFPAEPANSTTGPPEGLTPPFPNPTTEYTPTFDDPCALVLPHEVQQIYHLNVFGQQGRGPDMTKDSPLPENARFTQDRTCVFPLAASAGELRIRVVDLADQASTKAVFEQFRQGAVSPVPDCGNECAQAPGHFVARKANRVLLFLDVRSDIAPPRQVSLEPLAIQAVAKA